MTTQESRTPAGEFEIAVSGLLANYAPPDSLDSTSSRASVVYPDDVFDKIAKYLVQAGKQQWSLRPRTYIVLRLINRLDNMDAFVLDGLFDIAFPYTYNRLPASLSSGTRNSFLEKQAVVLSKAGDLEMEHGRHRHFSASADTNFAVVKQLGSGYFGVVDHVQSKLSLEEYARKRTLRARTFSKDKKALKVFENELSNLKRLSHRHLVQYVGSYTDPRYIGLLMSPVADCDLRVYLAQTPFPHNLVSSLRSFIGCLCSAVSYLHSQKCRHKDIKPGNILVKGDVVLISDFGTSRNWSDRSKGTTTGESGPFTPGYAAPEVVAWEARNESSDIWSLGCVYLDIVTVLKGETPKTKDQFFGDNGNGGKNARVNPQALDLWLSKLSSAGDADNQPIAWIQQMLELGPKNRISSVQLLDSVLGYADQHIYYGHCCADQDEDASSCKSSEFADSDSADAGAEEETNATSVLSGQGRDVKARSEALSSPPVEESSTEHSTLGVALNGSSAIILSDGSISASGTSQSAPNLVSGSYLWETSPREERKESTSPQVEVPLLQSKNPFRPGYIPSIYPSSSQATVSDSALPPVFTNSDDDPFGLNSHDSAPTREEMITVSDPRRPEDRGRTADREYIEKPNDDTWPSSEASQASLQYQQSSLGSNSSMDHLSLLFEAAASGDVHKLLRYSSAGNSNYIQEGALGKSIFHAAAVNDQVSVMQLLLDMGCPIFPNDVTTYILPARETGRLNIDSHYLANELPPRLIDRGRPKLYESATEQRKNTSTSQSTASMLPAQHSHTDTSRTYGDEVQSVDRPRGLGIPEWYDALHGLGVIRLALGTDSIAIIRNDFANIRPSYSIGPWTPAGYHWGLTIVPDPEALHKAIRSSNYDSIVDCLGDEGCDPNLRDSEGKFPLDIAMERKNTLFIQTLIVYGADPGLRDSPELREVLSQMHGHEAEPRNEVKALHPRLQLPQSVQAPWQNLLASLLSGKGFREAKPRLEVSFVVNGGADWLEIWQVAVPSRFHWLLNTSGKLVWYEEPERFVDAYPEQCFELDSTPISRATHDERSKIQAISKRNWLKNAIRGFPSPQNLEEKRGFYIRVGGNSLLIARLQSRIRQVFNVTIHLVDLLSSNTLVQMARKVEEGASVEVIDWDQKTKSPSMPITLRQNQKKRGDGPLTVLVTGSTGNLAKRVLPVLEANPLVGKIVCVAVRDKPNEASRSILRGDKIVQHAGDLSAPRLGLTTEQFQGLSNEVDVILHMGALRSFWDNYHILRLSNVESIKELVHLAAPNRIPIHFMSTSGVLPRDVLGSAAGQAPSSAAAYEPPLDGSNGYVASKWAGERILERAFESLGVPAYIYRLQPTRALSSDTSKSWVLDEFVRCVDLTAVMPDCTGWEGHIDLIPGREVAERLGEALISSTRRTDVGEAAKAQLTRYDSTVTVSVDDIETHLEELRGMRGFDPVPVLKWMGRIKAVGFSYVLASLEAMLTNGNGGEKLTMWR